MTADELRKKYLDFFEEKEHAIIPSFSLIPENDPTALFINSGMHPLVPYLMGEKHSQGTRLANTQKCIRTIDIDEVGDTTHHTFFEMLGNWSLGDSSESDGIGRTGYFKKEAIEWSWEFLTDPKWLGLDKNRIAVSVFAGDKNAPFDEEAYDIWEDIFKNSKLPKTRIAKLPKENNWWGPAGETGPCGPDTEIFYWAGDPNEVPKSFNDDNDLWIEAWNNVFMQYNKKEDGTFEKLAQQNVDTGMGLERVLTALNGLDDSYKTELFLPIIKKIEELSGKSYNDEQNKLPMRIIADHIKAAVFIIADGIEPSNTERGYILRRLIRRAVRQGHILRIDKNFIVDIAKVIQEIYKNTYPEILEEKMLDSFQAEEKKFRDTLDKGLRVFGKKLEAFTFKPGDKLTDKLLETYSVGKNKKLSPPQKADITGDWLFGFYQTFGFPFEMIIEELKSIGIESEEKEIEEYRGYFNDKLKKHQELSRTASSGMFKGGLADTKEKTTQLHTAAHLMLAGLREVLGEHVHQKGSNINGERIRFDFSHSEKMTEDQIKAVEDYVNEAIQAKVDVKLKEMNLNEAKQQGAEGAFDSKYGDKVKVYDIGDYSKEICGGPHVENTEDIKGMFKITKEKSSSAGVRRIKAVIDSA
ncbi:MAG: alanine--tRNA ligase [Patescibacteria group bacterium]|nr:alanine--tRNA ligase [Patescibacteria group bacterium]